MIHKLSADTLDAIAAIKSANPEFMRAAMRVFDPKILPAEFAAWDVAEILLQMNVPNPTDWRVMGPLMRRALSCDVIELTGNMATRRAITLAHTCNHSGPTYRLVDPLLWIPPKKLRKKWRERFDGAL